MKEEYLFEKGYKKTNENTYEKVDDKGFVVELVFNSNTTIDESKKIQEEVIQILTRQDI